MRSIRYLLFCFILSIQLFAGELFRVSIQNIDNGEIKVSIDEGKSWVIVGSVLRAGKGVEENGFTACKFGKLGTVVAVSSYAIHIKIGEPRSIFSILAKEMEEIPNGFGGQITGQAGILTDIKAGTSIFKDLSPTVSSKVFLNRDDKLYELPPSYKIGEGEEFVILVEEKELPRWIVFENKEGGNVYLFKEGRREVIAQVRKAITGIGRFDGTEFTGIGKLNTVHPGALTVSTVPGGASKFDYTLSGGFQIVPLYEELPSYVSTSPPYLIVSSSPGSYPLFDGAIGLWDWKGQGFKVDVSGDGMKWEEIPNLKGKIDDISSYLSKQSKEKNKNDVIKLIRISFPQGDLKFKIKEVLRGIITMRDKIVRGKLDIDVRIKGEGASIVELRIDGRLRGIKNFPPFVFSIDTSELMDGEHIIEVIAKDINGDILASQKEVIYVDNEENFKL
ncbi:Ig-like domain-containing protein [bacterium]|nr:Ig-like domain-containing protein [bacterium]